MKTDIEIISEQPFAEGSTAPEHLVELYNVIKEDGVDRILELGSYFGHSTVALALGAKLNGGYVISIDLCDAVAEEDRLDYWDKLGIQNIYPQKNSVKEYLSKRPLLCVFDFIFHDAEHGDHVIPEYIQCWTKLNSCGTLAIHDFDAITNQEEFIKLLSPRKYTISKDFKNRELAIFYK